ncbi:hypothetical protein FXN61_03500 [Lentzea sp. PSKA42]|uniref:DUF2199 domain-containing protein n=1 Tax=Lentzea indica TaxID=2604800 RepID=A0ABX1FAV5_9PSEU|nr:hypothetical protein [Lentzea indica]NKE55939.1 hypothetical protein [Lentzea indica]
MTACQCCGAEIDESGALDLNLGLPPELDGVSPERLAGGNVLLAGDVAYARCVLPVELTGDLELWFGAWMRITAGDARRADAVWGGPGYTSLRLTGTFAHDIKPWDDLDGAEVVAEVHEPGYLPEFVEHPLLGTTWDRDEVLSAFLVELPVSIQQKLIGAWSIERTGGMTPHLLEDGLRFVGPGRTVFIDVRRAPGVPPDRFLEMALDGAPDVPEDQRFLARDGAELRHALWLTTGTARHEFFGHVVRFGDMLLVTCIHDDPADHAWARHVLNTVRYGA